MWSEPTTRDLASLLNQRPACSVVREDGIARGQSDYVIPAKKVKQDAGPLANQPLFLNSSMRPVKVLVALNTSETNAIRPLIYVPIWKCATSSMIDVVVPQLFNCTLAKGWYNASRPATRSQRMCRQGPHMRPTSPDTFGVDFPDGRHSTKFYMGPPTTNLVVQRALAAGGLTIVIVRDPLKRFVSGWMPRNDLNLCRRQASGVLRAVDSATSKNLKGRRLEQQQPEDLAPCPSIVHSLEAHAHNISASGANFPYWRTGWVHWLSQTFFLTATDGGGRRLRFDHAVRVEHLDADLAAVKADLTGMPPSAASEKTGLAASKRKNTNYKGVTDLYAAALASRPIICLLCRIYADDYGCLGVYPLPERCLDTNLCPPDFPAPVPTRCEGSSWRCRMLNPSIVPPFDDTNTARSWACEGSDAGRCTILRGENGHRRQDRAWGIAKGLLNRSFPYCDHAAAAASFLLMNQSTAAPNVTRRKGVAQEPCEFLRRTPPAVGRRV